MMGNALIVGDVDNTGYSLLLKMTPLSVNKEVMCSS